MAITVNAQGQVWINNQWVYTDQSDEFRHAVDKAKQNGAAVNANTTFAIVEKGDGLLKIGEQYGVQNGNTLAYDDNKHLGPSSGRNPDLIYAGEAVVVNGGNADAGDAAGNPFAGNPIPQQPRADGGPEQSGGTDPTGDTEQTGGIDPTGSSKDPGLENIQKVADEGGDVQGAVRSYLTEGNPDNGEFNRRVERVNKHDFGTQEGHVNNVLVDVAHDSVVKRVSAGQNMKSEGDPSVDNQRRFLGGYLNALPENMGQQAVNKLCGADVFHDNSEIPEANSGNLARHYFITEILQPVVTANDLNIDVPPTS